MRFIRESLLDAIKREVENDLTIKEVVLNHCEWEQLKREVNFRGDHYRILRPLEPRPYRYHPCECHDIRLQEVVIRPESTFERYYK